MSVPVASPTAGGSAKFTTTRWSVISQAGKWGEAASREALHELCTQYWYPLYAFVRRKGYSPEDAADLTQSFFVKLVEHNLPAAAQPEKGRFRTFLLISLERFLANDWQKARAIRRGGGAQLFSLESLIEERGEAGYLQELADHETAEHLYQRAWAETVLTRVFQRLEAECLRRGDARFAVLRSFLAPHDEAPQLAAAAADLGLSLAAFKSLLHRFRGRYRELLLDEIRQTVNSPDEVEEEMKGIIQALRK
jgi:RNA polymerase sigma-70 factor (ECF subfamily)